MLKAAVYVIKCVPSGKVYVGSSVEVKARLATHKRLLRRGSHTNEYLQRAWNKYGASAFKFEILERCAIPERLLREQSWINKLKAEDEAYGYNLIPTRESQLYGKKIAVYQRQGWAKLSKAERRERNAHLFEPEMRTRAAKLSGLARSTPEHKERQRKIAEKYLCSEENRKGNKERMLKRWQDPEFRAKMKIAMKIGRDKTNAKRRKTSKGLLASYDIVRPAANKSC